MASANAVSHAPAKLQSNTRGIALMILSMFLMSSMDAGSKVLVETLPVFQILWIRFLFFLGFGLMMAGRAGIGEALASPQKGLQVFRGVLLVCEVGTFILMFKFLPLADAHAIVAVVPLLATALSVVILKEAVGLKRWTAVGIGFIGVMIIIRPGMGVFGPGALIALAGSCMFGLFIVTTRIISRKDSAKTTMLFTSFIGALVMTVIGPFFWEPPDLTTWGLLIVVGLLGCGAHFLFIMALEVAPASVLQPFNYTMLVWAAVLGWIIFGHLPDHWTMTGAVIVVGSGLYAWYREFRTP